MSACARRIARWRAHRKDTAALSPPAPCEGASRRASEEATPAGTAPATIALLPALDQHVYLFRTGMEAHRVAALEACAQPVQRDGVRAVSSRVIASAGRERAPDRRPSVATTRGNPKDDDCVTRSGPTWWPAVPAGSPGFPARLDIPAGLRGITRGSSAHVHDPGMPSRSRGARVEFRIALRNRESGPAVQRAGEARARRRNICDEPRVRARLTRDRSRTKVPPGDHGQICQWGSVRLHSNCAL
jgi:hypothetical protein